MAYVYRHIRLDKNVPFYIGMGSQDNYSRAYTKQSRNRHWHNIANKTEYEVEIIVDGISWDDANLKEVEFIKLYGRKQHGGILCNLTDGGGGTLGLVTSEVTKKLQSIKKIGKSPPNKGVKQTEAQRLVNRESHKGIPAWNKGVPLSEERRKQHSAIMKGRVSAFKGRTHSVESKKKMSLANIGRVAWNKGVLILPHVKEAMRKALIGKPSWNKGIPMKEEVKKSMSEMRKGKQPAHLLGRINTIEQIDKMVAKKIMTVYQFDLFGNYISEYTRAEEASKKTGLKLSSIAASCRGLFGNRKTNKHGGSLWSYEKSLDWCQDSLKKGRLMPITHSSL